MESEMEGEVEVEMQVVLIPCKWADCNVEVETVLALNSHITQHLDAYNTESDSFVCHWQQCEFQTNCFQQLCRHAYYHGFYAQLLIVGQLECEMNPELPKCNAKARKGDIVPQLAYDYRCEWHDCGRTFASIVEFQDHIDKHASFEYDIQKTPSKKTPQVACCWSDCALKADNKYRLVEHVRKHSLKKYVACFHCGEMYRTRSIFFEHLQRQAQNNTQVYQCAQCYKYFSTLKLLRAHVVKHVNCFKCTLCEMTCTSPHALALHVRYRHLKEKPVKCPDCEYRCVRTADLSKHTARVHANISHHCTYAGCNYVVRNPNTLRRHILEVHKNQPYIYACHCCEKAYKGSKSLSSHLKKEHGFQLPPGHKRFQYRPDENGYYRLETMRIESIEVATDNSNTIDSVEQIVQTCRNTSKSKVITIGKRRRK